MGRRVRVGDVLEIETPKGFAYAQFTHKHDQFGALIRVLPGVYGSRPASLEEIVNGPSAFVVFYPVGAAVSRQVARVVDNMPIPEHAREFPLFRCGTPDLTTKKVKTWWFWDGIESWPVGELTADQRKMPVRMLVNHTALVELITSAWAPERDRM
jgi:hypothetical protein